MSVVAVTIRFPAPKDYSTGEPLSDSEKEWIAGITRAALGGVSAWCAGAHAFTEPTVSVEEAESVEEATL